MLPTILPHQPADELPKRLNTVLIFTQTLNGLLRTTCYPQARLEPIARRPKVPPTTITPLLGRHPLRRKSLGLVIEHIIQERTGRPRTRRTVIQIQTSRARVIGMSQSRSRRGVPGHEVRRLGRRHLDATRSGAWVEIRQGDGVPVTLIRGRGGRGRVETRGEKTGFAVGGRGGVGGGAGCCRGEEEVRHAGGGGGDGPAVRPALALGGGCGQVRC